MVKCEREIVISVLMWTTLFIHKNVSLELNELTSNVCEWKYWSIDSIFGKISTECEQKAFWHKDTTRMFYKER